MSQSSPAQHGVWLSCEDGGIHHKSCIVHNERYSFSQSQSTAMPLFTAEVIHIDHIAQSLADCLGVVLCSRRNKGSRYVSPDQGPTKMGIGERNPGRSWTRGSWGRASVSTFTIWGRGRHMNTTEPCCYKMEKKQWLGKLTLIFIYLFSYLFIFSSPCCRVGEVTFLMQGVSWLSPLSWEESRERSLERRRCSR